MKFIRVHGRIIPILKKTGVGKAVQGLKIQAKAFGKIVAGKNTLEKINNFRARIPGLKQTYKGTRYGDALLDVEDARQTLKMRTAEKILGQRTDRLRKIQKMNTKSIKRAGWEVGGASALAVGSTGAIKSYKKSSKRG